MQSDHDQIRPARSPRLRQAGAVLAGVLCVVAAVAIWALVTGSFDDTSVRVLASALAAALATLSGLAGATMLERADHRRLLGQATIAASGIALALALVLIWVRAAPDSDVTWRAFGISVAAMFAGAHASLMYGRLRPEDGRGVVTLTKVAVGSASIAALLTSSLLLFVTDTVGSGVWRLLGVLVVIAVLTTLLAPLARKITPDSNSGAATDATPASEPDPSPKPGKRPTNPLMLGRQPAHRTATTNRSAR